MGLGSRGKNVELRDQDLRNSPIVSNFILLRPTRDMPRSRFYPTGFATLGSWGPSAIEILEEIGKKIGEHSGDDRSMDYLWQRIAIEIQRGNGVCVLGTVQDGANLDDPFFLLSVVETA